MNRQDAKEAKTRQEPDAQIDELAHAVIGAAIQVHRELGPGFLEAVYRRSLAIMLNEMGYQATEEEPVDVYFHGHLVGQGKIDLWVAERLVVELKATEQLHPIHKVQTRSYVKAKKEILGLLINFNAPHLKDGIVRVIDSA